MIKICGAKKRGKNETCQSTRVMENGRCRMHGGATPKGIASPHYKSGNHSKYQYLPQALTPRLEGVFTDNLENLEQSIGIQKVLETTYLEKLGTGESSEAWLKLRKAVSDYDAAAHSADPAKKKQGQAQAVGMIRFIVNDGLSQSFLYRDIQSIQESQRKLSETLSKVRKEAQEVYTYEEWNEMLAVLANVIKTNIKDPVLLQAIQNDLRAKSNGIGIDNVDGVH